MRVEYSERALSDLEAIHEYQKLHWPGIGERFDARLVEIEKLISDFPNGTASVEGRPGVHVVPFISFPYRLFYTVEDDSAGILHVRHTSRAPWRG